MKRPDLVFMTPENEAAMNAEMEARKAACVHDWETIKALNPEGEPTGHNYTVCRLCLSEQPDE